MQLDRLINDYCVWHEVAGHSPATIDWYRGKLGTFMRWLAANARSTHIPDITVADARAFIQAEQQRTTLSPGHPSGNERQGKLSDRTIHCYVRVIRSFWKWLVAEEYLTKNCMERLALPKLEKRTKEIISVAEVETLLAQLNPNTFLDTRMYAMIALFYDSGLRAGELIGIDLGAIRWGDYQIKVNGKTGERLVPFSPATHKAVRRYLGYRETFATEGCDALFISADGERMTRDAVTHAVKRLGIAAGIPRLHPHLLRHSAAVAAILNGANQFEIKRILGHSNLSTTDGYMDLAQQHLQQQHKKFSPMSKVSERRTAGRKRRLARRPRTE